MIIFDLDGTLADCEHRRHLIVKNHPDNFSRIKLEQNTTIKIHENKTFEIVDCMDRPDWKPDWKAFYEACDKDEPINPVIEILRCLWVKEGEQIEIWSGRCESVRDKTLEWLTSYVFGDYELCPLKMRPIGDSTPDDVLKERWLDEHLEMVAGKRHCKNVGCNHYKCASPIKMVFDDRPKVIRMWRRRGIFVFNCCQHDEEF